MCTTLDGMTDAAKLEEWQAAVVDAEEAVVHNTRGRDKAIREALAPAADGTPGLTLGDVIMATGLSRTRLYQIKKGGASDE